MRSLADSIAEPGGVYSTDEDPQLIEGSLPVMLKIMEQLADGLPRHPGIRLALARTFTSYSVGFIQDDADRLNETDVEKARALYLRSRRLSLRAYRYGLAGLEITLPGIGQALAGNSREAQRAALARAKKSDVPLLYWTAAALGSAISVSKDDLQLVGQLPIVELLMTRALELDESYDEGALHEFFITYDSARGKGQGGGPDKARAHFLRALELGKNKKLATLVTFAEAVDVDQQNKKEFVELLQKVVAYDVDVDPPHRLTNVLAQKRARWLLARTSDLFAD